MVRALELEIGTREACLVRRAKSKSSSSLSMNSLFPGLRYTSSGSGYGK